MTALAVARSFVGAAASVGLLWSFVGAAASVGLLWSFVGAAASVGLLWSFVGAAASVGLLWSFVGAAARASWVLPPVLAFFGGHSSPSPFTGLGELHPGLADCRQRTAQFVRKAVESGRSAKRKTAAEAKLHEG
ncbi:hypothetical protein AK812_SmicGene23173 [Symbiodinium microadriaticum]|uniref:Uncharacterized protein n=1 Tax=Symbiodinium microadriaticum TaxID=2951 RepID=A0A1Q9DHX1_SYMMI|nr:hypothetical protein AK812_SmicGene23173 [Symbiodinium microadriaticum]